MKTLRICLYLFALCSFNSLFAQEESGGGRLFPQFEKGTVFLKNGGQASASLNYDMIQQQMLFLSSDGTEMKFTNPMEVAVVKIGKAAAYGGYSQTQASTSYSSLHTEAEPTSQVGKGIQGNVKLNSGDKFKMVTESVYYLQSGGKYKKFNSAKTLGKLFKGHESEIETFADRESVNFRKPEDVARIVEYGYSLK